MTGWRITEENPIRDDLHGFDFERCAALHNLIVERGWTQRGLDPTQLGRTTWWQARRSRMGPICTNPVTVVCAACRNDQERQRYPSIFHMCRGLFFLLSSCIITSRPSRAVRPRWGLSKVKGQFYTRASSLPLDEQVRKFTRRRRFLRTTSSTAENPTTPKYNARSATS
jgi:hypothetical protein